MGYFTQMYHSDLPSRAVMVYMYLKDRADVNGQCYPSVSRISRELKISRSTVKRAIADLDKAGFIIREQRYRENGASSSTLYTLR
jgi:predicted transcriptional regulator